MTVGILGAMAEEVDSIVQAMQVRSEGMAGRHTWWRGSLGDSEDVVVAFSRWGKVAAASAATWMLVEHDIEHLLFTGVAGGLTPDLRPGDVVVGDRLWQHDFDARPLIPRHEIPALGRADLPTDDRSRRRLLDAALQFLEHDIEGAISAEARRRFNLYKPRVIVGGIASGDRFVHDPDDANDLRDRLPDVRCVEMEGAAVAQICACFDVPFSIVRMISDTADAEAPIDFQGFVTEVAGAYAIGIVSRWLGEPAT